MFKKIVKNTTLLSSGVLLSRILGFVRDILIARYFGTSRVLEAFIVAFRIPNILRSLFGEGFSDSVATPVFSEYGRDRTRLNVLGGRLLTVFLIVLSLVTLFGIFFAKYFVIAIAPGFLADTRTFELATRFARITFVYLFFIGLVAILSSLLYSLKKFALASFITCLFNVSIIIGIVFLRKVFSYYILAISVIAAGFLQYFFLRIYLARLGFSLKSDVLSSFRDPDVKRMIKLFVPRIWASIIYHLNVFIDTVFSSLTWIVGQGALAAIYYSNRIIQFPLALIAVAISRVMVVDLSRLHKQDNKRDFRKLFIFSLRNMLFFIIPVTVILGVMSGEIIELMFFRGSFTRNSLAITAPVLLFYSPGLFFFCGIKLLVNCFYSLKDTKTPAYTAAVSLAANAVLSFILIFPLKAGGVALASSLAGILNFWMLYRLLVKKVGRITWPGACPEIFKLIAVSICAGIVIKILWAALPYHKYVKALICLPGWAMVLLLLGAAVKIGRAGRFLRYIVKGRNPFVFSSYD